MSLKTTLIDVDALAALAPHDVLIIDCRFELSDPASGARDYAQGHVPGAIYASLDRDLSDLSRQAEGGLSARTIGRRTPGAAHWESAPAGRDGKMRCSKDQSYAK